MKRPDLELMKKRQAALTASFNSIPQTDPWVPITLGADVYKLEFSFAAVEALFRATGKNLNSGDFTNKDLADSDTLVILLMAGLTIHNPEVTEAELKAKLTLRHRMYYIHCLQMAMEATQPDYTQIEAILGDVEALAEEAKEAGLEAGDTTGPLPRIVPSPISGGPAEV